MERSQCVWVSAVLLLVIGGGPARSSGAGTLASEGPAVETGGVQIAVVSKGDEAPADMIRVGNLAPDSLATFQGEGPKSKKWPHLLSVFVVHDRPTPSVESLPPMRGSYHLGENGGVEFHPRFPLVRGLSYRVVVRDRGRKVEKILSLPRVDRESEARVTAIYPSSNRLPMNLLRLYVWFSEPMSIGQSSEEIELYRKEGEGFVRVQDAFLELEPELWDPARRRLTLLFDPARIKRGLVPHKQLDLPLVVGDSYRLVVKATFLDGDGCRLVEEFEKHFSVTDLDRRSPDPREWRLEAPGLGTRAPLTIRLGESLDSGLLRRLFSVWGPRGNPVHGRVELLEEETVWAFFPVDSWKRGEYEVSVSTLLEDLAGNNLRGLFDVDLSEERVGIDADEVLLPFLVN